MNEPEKKFLLLNDIESYKIAFRLSNYIWDIVIGWEHFARSTIGRQFVEAADSISANIAEGFGRHFKKDKVNFYRFSKGSVKECLDWNEKAKTRKLLNEQQYNHIHQELMRLPKSLNSLIKYTVEKLNE